MWCPDFTAHCVHSGVSVSPHAQYPGFWEPPDSILWFLKPGYNDYICKHIIGIWDLPEWFHPPIAFFFQCTYCHVNIVLSGTRKNPNLYFKMKIVSWNLCVLHLWLLWETVACVQSLTWRWQKRKDHWYLCITFLYVYIFLRFCKHSWLIMMSIVI